MLKRIFKKNGNGAAAPEGKRIYAIGDIHGCAAELDTLLDLIEADFEAAMLAGSAFKDKPQAPMAAGPQFIFLGDYVDRGPDSKGVLDKLVEIQAARKSAVFLKGNHEALLQDFISDPEDMLHWLEWGGEETLLSYGLKNILTRAAEDLVHEFKQNLPASHAKFLKSLRLTHLEGDYLFVHAGLRPGVALEEQQEEDLLWIRKLFHNTPTDKRPAQTVVHGHQPVKKPIDAGWRIDVDTGACWTGKLTAIVLDGTSRRFIST